MWERGEYNLYKMESVTTLFLSPYTRSVLGRNLRGLAAVQMQNGAHAFYITSRDLAFFNKFISQIFHSEKKFAEFIAGYKKLKKEFITTSQKVGQKATQMRQPQDLLSALKQLLIADARYMLIGQWSFFYLAELAEEKVKKILSADEARIVLTPEYMSQIRQEREQLLRIALLKPARPRAQRLRQHAKNFAWIPCINILDPQPWSLSFFQRELNAVLKSGQAKKELQSLRKTFSDNHKAFNILWRRSKAKTRTLLRHAHELSFIKDDRDDARRQAYFYATPLYRAIARSLRIAALDLLLYTNQEIQRALQTGKLLALSELGRRRVGYVLLIKKGKVVVKTGQEYKKFLALITAGQVIGHEVKGLVAAPGLVVGRAKIIPSARFLSKVKRGDILITTATHPDYLPAMRLAAAFVTDEGGLTSHAAIVAREMGKPCIVGTKNATKVFKDGDIIEVDANKGIVRKI